MHAQLQVIVDEFEAATKRLNALVQAVPLETWTRRPDPERWSIGECVAHLNLTSLAYLPLLDDGLVRARALGGATPARFHRDLGGWLLWKTMGPPVRFRVKTTAAFVPSGDAAPHHLISEFDRLQREQIAHVRRADGLQIDR